MEEQQRKQREVAMTQIHYLAQLAATMPGSHADIGRQIGISGSAISKALSTGQARLVTELAAKAVIMERASRKGDLFAEQTPAEILEHIRGDIARAKERGLTNFRFDEEGVLRASVIQEL